MNKKAVFILTGILIVAGLAAWVYQYREGLILTDLRNGYSWGLYVSGLAFFVGNAAGGLVLSSLIYLFGVTALKPFARIGALTAFANVTAAMFAILPDIGQPVRLYHMLLHPNLSSPLVWDVAVLNLYAGLSLVYLYLLMLPDLKGSFKKLALNVQNPAKFSETWAKRIAPFSLVAAIGIHVVTAWIFATQGAREWWHSAVLAPDFVAAAIASGTSVVLVVSVLAYGIKEEHQPAYRIMTQMITVSLLIHIFFMYNDYFIQAWYGSTDALETLAITFKEYLPAHLFEVLAPLAAVLLLSRERVRKNAMTMITSCGLLIAGIFVHRFLLMPAAFGRIPLTFNAMGFTEMEWSVPIASGRFDPLADTFTAHPHYFPTLIEIVIFTGVIAYACFVIALAIDRLPILRKVES